MNRYLITKLLAINLAVIAFVMAVVWLSIDTLAAGYFVDADGKVPHFSRTGPRHVCRRRSPLSDLGVPGGPVVLAALLSFVMMRRVLGPLMRMTRISGEIAAGDFSARVPADTRDEVGQLGQSI